MWLVAVFVCVGWMLSLCLHEFGHAITAYWGGDTSVKEKGYLTLNPFKYTDPGLSLFMPLLFLMLGGFALPGGAVYIDISRLRNRLWNSAVSAAGSVANIIFVLILTFIFHTIWHPQEITPENRLLTSFATSLAYTIFLNIYVVVINLLPIPGIDGYGIIQPWLPPTIERKFNKLGNYGVWILIALLWFYPPFALFLRSLADSATTWLQIPESLVERGGALFGVYAQYLVLGLIFILWLFRDKRKDLYRRGIQQISDRKYNQAISTLDKVAHQQPTNPNPWFMKGYALYCLGQYDDALAVYDKALAIKPDFADVWYYQGVVFQEIGKTSAAFDCYNKALEIEPDYPEALTERGQIYLNQENFDLALADFEKATQLSTDYSEAWLKKGDVLSLLERDLEAIDAYGRVIKLQPRSEVWIKLAALLEKNQQFAAIIALYDQKLRLQPEDIKVWNYRGLIFQKLERLDDAKLSFEQALRNSQRILKRQTKDAQTWFQKGLALTKLQRYSEAIKAYDSATQIQPEFAEAFYNIACCYAQQNNLELTLDNLNRAINLNSEYQQQAKIDLDFDAIRDYPSFQDLLKTN